MLYLLKSTDLGDIGNNGSSGGMDNKGFEDDEDEIIYNAASPDEKALGNNFFVKLYWIINNDIFFKRYQLRLHIINLKVENIHSLHFILLPYSYSFPQNENCVDF